MRSGSNGRATHTAHGGPIRRRRLARPLNSGPSDWPGTDPRAGRPARTGGRGHRGLPRSARLVAAGLGRGRPLLRSLRIPDHVDRAASMADSPGFLRQFYLRRGLRIWPIYYLTLARLHRLRPSASRALRLVRVVVLPDLHAGPSALLVDRSAAIPWLPEPHLEPGHRGAVLPALAGARAALRSAPGAAPGDRLRRTLGHGSRPWDGPRRSC